MTRVMVIPPETLSGAGVREGHCEWNDEKRQSGLLCKTVNREGKKIFSRTLREALVRANFFPGSIHESGDESQHSKKGRAA